MSPLFGAVTTASCMSPQPQSSRRFNGSPRYSTPPRPRAEHPEFFLNGPNLILQSPPRHPIALALGAVSHRIVIPAPDSRSPSPRSPFPPSTLPAPTAAGRLVPTPQGSAQISLPPTGLLRSQSPALKSGFLAPRPSFFSTPRSLDPTRGAPERPPVPAGPTQSTD